MSATLYGSVVSVSVNPPKTPVTKGSKGMAVATVPNVCKMPGPPAPFVPAPLPNIGTSDASPKKYSKKVTFAGKNVAIKGATFASKGDVASKGTGGGLVSSNTHGPTSFVGPGSLDVKVEGKNVQLLGDPMLNNCGGSGNPPNAATLVGVVQPPGMIYVAGDEDCPLCGKAHGDDGRLEESEDTKDVVNDVINAIDGAIAAANSSMPDIVDMRKASSAAIVGLADVVNDGKAARRPFNKIIEANKTATRGHVGLTSMVGGVKCKCGRKYGGTSTVQYRDVTSRHSHHTPYPHHTLAEPPDFNTFKTRRFKKFQSCVTPVHQAKFREVWAAAQTKSDESLVGATDVNCYPPGSCAAQIFCVHAMGHSCRPIGLTERYYSSKGSMLFRKGKEVRLNVRESVDAEPRPATPAEVAGDKPIPPCGTCEVILQALLCCQDEDSLNCETKSAGTTCYRC